MPPSAFPVLFMRGNMRGIRCQYYTTTLHKGAFYIPAYVEELLKNVEQEY